jgi:hypothetical protein
MKKLFIGATLLALAVTVAGCAKHGKAEKKPAEKERPAATSTAEHKTTAPVEHKTMKPVVPASGTEHKATAPEAKKPETAKPEAAKPEANKPEAKTAGSPEAKMPAGTPMPKENK